LAGRSVAYGIAMIELAGVTKRYGTKVVVSDLTFSVQPGAVTGFLGPNGAGKSTTMRMMLDLDRPTAGQVLIDGKRYADLQNPLRIVGALLDAKAMHGGRSARDNLMCLALSNRIPASRVDEVLEEVGLTAVARHRPKGFSLGMGQRLGIAAALLGDPEILIFDEPVNGLDPEGIHWIRMLMRSRAARGCTVLVSSHLMSEMTLTADNLVVIGQGKLLANTSMSEFIAQNSRTYVRVRTPEPEKLRDALAAAGMTVVTAPDGVFEVVDVPVEQVGDVLAAAQVGLHELSPQHASLEEAFIQMTGNATEYRSGPAAPVPGQPNGAAATPNMQQESLAAGKEA